MSMLPSLAPSPRRKISNSSKYNRPRMKSKSRFSVSRSIVNEAPVFLPMSVKKKEVAPASHYKAKWLFRICIDKLESREEKTCVRALEELYLTEAKYVEELEHLANVKQIVKTFKKSVPPTKEKGKLRTQQFVPIVEESDLNAIFINVKPLQEVHKKIINGLNELLGELSDKLNPYKPDLVGLIHTICEKYTEIAPFWAMYTHYIKQYETAVSTMHKLKKTNTAFQQKLVLVEEAYELKLATLINKPLQRITKYPLLFFSIENKVKKLIKKDQENNVLKQLALELGGVTETIHKAVNKVNVKVGVASEVNELGRINAEIGSKLTTFELLQPWRRLKLETKMEQFEFGPEGSYTARCILFLFNDYIVVAAHMLGPKCLANNNSSMFRRPNRFLNSSSQSSSSLRKSQRLTFGSQTLRRMKGVSVRSTLSRSGTRRKMYESNADEEHPIRDLTPLAELKIINLSNPVIEQEVEHEEEIYTLKMTYHDEVNEIDMNVRFFMGTERNCIKLRDLIGSLQEEALSQKQAREELTKTKD